MTTAALQHDAFAPRQPPGMRAGLAMAIAAHVLLVLALAWSVRWHASEPEGVIAELWSATPQIAAPRPATPEPPPPPPPRAEPWPVPRPQPTPRVVEPPADTRADAQIAIERAAAAKAKRDAAEREEAAREAQAARRLQAKKDEAQRAEAVRREQARRADDDKRREQVAAEQERKKQLDKARQDDARLAAAREANLKRAMRQAGTSDEATATGSATRTSGPSATYAGRIKARIMPNITLLSPVAGKPLAEVELRLAPDGTIVGAKLVKRSSSPIWDEAVLRAIEKTGVLPRDVDGRVVTPMIIALDPG